MSDPKPKPRLKGHFSFDKEEKPSPPTDTSDDESFIPFDPQKHTPTSGTRIPVTSFDLEDAENIDIEFIPAKEDLVPQHVILEIADQVLPNTPEVVIARENVSNMPLVALLSAVILKEEFTGRLDLDHLDRLIAAALISNADNIDDIYGLFDRRTTAIADELINMTMQEDVEDRRDEIAGFSKDAARVFAANLIGDLETIRKEIGDGAVFSDEGGSLQDLGHFIQKSMPMDKIDNRLAVRLVNTFNQTAEEQGVSTRITLRPTGNKKNPSGPKPPGA